MKIKNYFVIALVILTLSPLNVRAQSYEAQKISQSNPEIISLAPGKAITFWVKFKNTGSSNWHNYGTNKVVLRHRGIVVKSAFYHVFWLNGKDAATLSQATVKPKEEGLLKFALTAPSDGGLYWVKFDLMKGEKKIKGGEIEIPLRVVAPSASVKTPASSFNTNNKPSEQIASSSSDTYQMPAFNISEIKEDTNLLKEEPIVRVGLYSAEEAIKIKANGGYEIRDQDDHLLLRQTQGEESEVVFDFSQSRQFVNIGGQRVINTDSYLRFAPQNEQVILEISSYKNSPTWNANLNDNQFRGILETRYADPADGGSGRFWMINELKMESYLKGLAEANDVSPTEFLKALLIAARTYAAYYALDPVKHGIFTVTATEGDQVYRGYGMEKRSVNLSKAVDDTKGMIVFYDNKLAITPYYSQSDGRTRSWSEVWSGNKPWLVSKPDPYMKGKKMLGHGVGMSARGALFLGRDGYNFGQILKYYYTGVEIRKTY